MDEAELLEKLMTTFLGELEGHTRTLGQGLSRLDRGVEDDSERRELLAALFRAAHSLKGAAQAVSVETISSTCHAIEEVFAAVQAGRSTLTKEMIAALFGAVDAIADAGRRLGAKEEVSSAALADARRDLRDRAEGQKSPGEPRPPPQPPMVRKPAERSTSAPDRPAAGGGTARVPLEKLDLLLNLAGELLVARNQLAARTGEVIDRRDLVARTLASWPKDSRSEAVMRSAREMLGRLGHDLDRFADGLAKDEHRLHVAATKLEDQIRRVRMVPFGEAESMLERATREASRARGLDVELEMTGRDVDIDRAVFDRLRDPLVQLARNAVIHGAETAAERALNQKPERNRVTIAARLRGPNVEISVRDDGRGLDLEAIKRRATESGISVPTEARDIAALVFLPALSTSQSVTALAGRGVGLDVVKSQVELLHGSVRVFSEPKKGATFVITVPITLTTVRVLLVSAGGIVYAFATSTVERVARVAKDEIKTAFGREMALVGGSMLPIAPLAETIDAEAPAPGPGSGHVFAVAVNAGAQRMLFAVDELMAETEILVKPLGPRPLRAKHFSGASVLAGGQIALLVNAAELIRTAQASAGSSTMAKRFEEAARPKQRTVLVADDSVTTRLLETSILEAAGYEVLTAADGVEALKILHARPIDLVLADVEMPHMDGVELTQTIRSTYSLRDLPVILLTALESDLDRTRGLKAGANAYLLKRGFDQHELIQTIESIAAVG